VDLRSRGGGVATGEGPVWCSASAIELLAELNTV
jgi:hypothetical protein